MKMALRTVSICAAMSWGMSWSAFWSFCSASTYGTPGVDAFPKEHFHEKLNSMNGRDDHWELCTCDLPANYRLQCLIGARARSDAGHSCYQTRGRLPDMDGNFLLDVVWGMHGWCRPQVGENSQTWDLEKRDNGTSLKASGAVSSRGKDHSQQHRPQDEHDETVLAQNGRGRTRSRPRSPRRRRSRRGNDRRDERGKRSRGHWAWEPAQASSSYRKLPPWRSDPANKAGWNDWTAGTSSGSGLRRESGEPKPAKAKAAPANPMPSAAPDIRLVAIIPTLEQCGPTVRFWSDVCGVTDPMNTSANRSVLTDASIGSIVDTLSAMSQVERAGLYVGLIRFLGIMWADIMRAITIAENNDDTESFMQTTIELHMPAQNREQEGGKGLALENIDDATGLMQVLSKTNTVTFFGSRMAMLQAHFESMEVQQAAQIARSMKNQTPVVAKSVDDGVEIR